MEFIQQNFSWLFDGIGTTIISGIVGTLVGSVIGFKIGVRKTSKQFQKSGNDSIQKQIIDIDNPQISKEKQSHEIKLNQTQKAGHNANQLQVGKNIHGKR